MDVALSDPTRDRWLATLVERDPVGLDPLGPDHAAYFVDGDDTLIVGFQHWSPAAQLAFPRAPTILDCAAARGWSCLVLLTRRADWFRAPIVAEYFDAQTDSGFFDSFRRVIFTGSGMGGYAACAYSAAAPGSRVLAVAPQATLDPAIAGWDDRFPAARRLDFTSRFGFAPSMLDAAEHAYILVDPRRALDAMHASLFSRPNVSTLHLPDLGDNTMSGLMGLGVLDGLMDHAVAGSLSVEACARLMRARRMDVDWVARRVQTCLNKHQPARALRVALHALAHTPGPQAEGLVQIARRALRATLA